MSELNSPDDDSTSREIWRRFNLTPHLQGKESIRGLKELNGSIITAVSRIPALDSAVSRASLNADKELSAAETAHDKQQHSKARGHLEIAANHIADAATMIVGQGQGALNHLTEVPEHLSAPYYAPEASLHMLEGQEVMSHLMDVAHLGKAHEHVRDYVDSIPKGK